MTCYLVRHGKDDDSIRGGWNNAGLTEEGAGQVMRLAGTMRDKTDGRISRIFASDLERARQTALILADGLDCPVEYLPEFREVNNGDLAGMKHDQAKERYPNLFWNTLEWDEHYPNGESPREFFERVSAGWQRFRQKMAECGEDVVLVTHGGVINVILHLVYGLEYSNQKKPFVIENASVTAVEI